MTWKLTETWVDCDCHSPDHAVKFWIDDDGRIATMSIHLIPERNIFKRIWRALQYISGRPYRFGEFDDFAIGPSNVSKVREALDRIKALGGD